MFNRVLIVSAPWERVGAEVVSMPERMPRSGLRVDHTARKLLMFSREYRRSERKLIACASHHLAIERSS